jgi:phosphatidylglycerol:prolipoprotein diacylglycerol transferase
MIPYFQLTSIPFGPITIQVWGLLVSLGIIAAVLLMSRLTKRQGLNKNLILDLAIWAIVGGFVGARLFHIFFYYPAFYLQYPSEIIKVWHGGLSSLGGFVGAALAVFIFARRRKFTLEKLLPYVDIASVSLWLGWGIGRIGCFLIHDHPGTLSHFVLAVQYPGGARHDLGLYDSLVSFVLFIIFFLLFKRFTKMRAGLVTAYSWMSYAIVRFLLDFLRASDLTGSDVRYLHLTPAQWGMVGLVAGLTLWLKYGKMIPKQS